MNQSTHVATSRTLHLPEAACITFRACGPPTILILLATLASCTHAVSTSHRDPTEREPLQYWCGWSPRPPQRERLLVDLRLRSGHENRRPTAADVHAVERRGGQVRHQFQVAMLRAVLDTAAVRNLIEGPDGIAEHATAVVDPTRYDVRAQVFFNRPITTEDEQALRLAGGRLLVRAPSQALDVVLPDSAIPHVAQLPSVRIVRAVGYGCVSFGYAAAGSGRQQVNAAQSLPLRAT